MAEPRVVPFAYALGVIQSAGVCYIEDHPAVDIIHLFGGGTVNHWKGSDEHDCRWELVSAP